MPVRIRLRRIGRKKQPSYRIVVADSAAPRGGSYVDAIGFYNPRQKPAELRLDLEKVESWIARGAEPTTTVASLIRKARKGGDDVVGYHGATGELAPERPGRKAQPGAQQVESATEAPAAAQATASEAEEPSPQTEAKADPEVMAEAHAESGEATAKPPAEAVEAKAAETESAPEKPKRSRTAAKKESPEAEASAAEEPAAEKAEEPEAEEPAVE